MSMNSLGRHDSQKQIAESIYELKCEGPLVKQMTEPGQFVHLKRVMRLFLLTLTQQQ